MNSQKKGLLIVIDGTDGSGKATQIDLLKKALKEKGINFETIDFPRYEDNIYGKLIGRYLSGEFGDLGQVNPYLMSLVFAGDRKMATPLIREWLDDGKIVIANRYVSSNKAHMGANLSENERPSFFRWIDELEYKANDLPKEDLTILLYVDAKLGQKNVDGKHTRKHLGSVTRDIHEASLKHLDEANKVYLALAKVNLSWKVVECMSNGYMKSKEEIHKEVMKIFDKKLSGK